MSETIEKRSPRRRRTGRETLLLAAGVLGGCLVMGWLGTMAARPYLQARHMREENARIEQRILAMKLENQRLRREATALKTEQGLEREARRLGYYKPNEAPLIVTK